MISCFSYDVGKHVHVHYHIESLASVLTADYGKEILSDGICRELADQSVILNGGLVDVLCKVISEFGCDPEGFEHFNRFCSEKFICRSDGPYQFGLHVASSAEFINELKTIVSHGVYGKVSPSEVVLHVFREYHFARGCFLSVCADVRYDLLLIFTFISVHSYDAELFADSLSLRKQCCQFSQ